MVADTVADVSYTVGDPAAFRGIVLDNMLDAIEADIRNDKPAVKHIVPAQQADRPDNTRILTTSQGDQPIGSTNQSGGFSLRTVFIGLLVLGVTVIVVRKGVSFWKQRGGKEV